jgi:hypothetical protein
MLDRFGESGTPDELLEYFGLTRRTSLSRPENY